MRVLAVFAQLDLALGVPARVVAEHRDERQLAAHRGLEFGDVEADRAVAEHGEHRRLRLEHPRRERERQRRADRAGDAVDQAAARPEACSGPIARTRRRRRSARCRDRARRKGAARGTPRRDAAAWRLRGDRSPMRPAGCRARRALRRARRARRGAAGARARSASRPPAACRPRSRTRAARPFPALARSTSAASGSIAIKRHAGSNAGPARPLQW